jgi:D-arabinose 1-dehydrogenase-like Zn-dependent alcohol dehydrogenase
MRAALLTDFNRDLELVELPDPIAQAGEVVVSVRACGAGLTLEHLRRGRIGGRPPMILGHELSGTIESLGPGVRGWAVGDEVTATFYLTCGDCDMCASGHEALCRHFGGFIGSARNGAFAEKVALPARNLVRVPKGIRLENAGVVADAIATPWHVATERLKAVPGKRIAVMGAGGGLGVHMCSVLRAFGASPIAIERHPAKLRNLESLPWLQHVIDSSLQSWEEKARDLDGFVDTVGTTETLAAGARLLGARGALVVLGVAEGAQLTANALDMGFKEISLMGTRYATRAEISASLNAVASGLVEPIIGARFPLADINIALQAIRSNEVFGRIVIDIG